MKRSANQTTTLKAWSSIPSRIRRAVSGLSARQLDLRGGSEGWSIREYVHHLVEANLVASVSVIAALGKPGCTYDWSWVMPDARWMRRLGYDKAPIEPAVELLEALCAHVAGVVRVGRGRMRRHVGILDTAGGNPRRRTVQQVLADEFEHAGHHLRDVEATRKAKGHFRRVARTA